MKILYIAHERELNGASLSLLNIIDQISSLHSVYLLTRYDYGEFWDEAQKRNCKLIYAEYYSAYERKTDALESKFYFLYSLIKWHLSYSACNQKAARKIAKLVIDEHIDIIHTNTSVIDIGARLNRLTHIPHVWHFREFLQEDQGLYPFYSQNHFFNLIKQYTTRVVTVSEAVKNKYLKYIPDEKICTVYNGVPLVQERKTYKLNKKCFNLLKAGFVNSFKGADIAIRAVQELNSEGYADIYLYLAGKGSIEKLNCSHTPDSMQNVVQLGYVKNLNTLRLQKMDLEIVCSQAEAFGRVTVEGMNCGLPIIGTNSGGTAELITPFQNGLLFDCGDVEKLKSNILYFYNNRSEVERMGNQAFEYASRNYSIKQCVQGILQVYEQILTSNAIDHKSY